MAAHYRSSVNRVDASLRSVGSHKPAVAYIIVPIKLGNFFSGELALQRGDKNEAMRLFNLSVAECPKAFIEYEGANTELKALGQTP
jgi:lipoprotein NlpI